MGFRRSSFFISIGCRLASAPRDHVSPHPPPLPYHVAMRPGEESFATLLLDHVTCWLPLGLPACRGSPQTNRAMLSRPTPLWRESPQTIKKNDLQDLARPLYLYTFESGDEQHLYKLLNHDLRELGEATGELRQYMISRWEKYMRCMLHSLRQLPLFRGRLYRGVAVHPDEVLDKYIVGSRIRWRSFTSASKSFEAVYGMTMRSAVMKNGNCFCVFFIIDVLTGSSIRDYSAYQHEDEVLLPPGLEYQVRATDLEQKAVVLIHACPYHTACKQHCTAAHRHCLHTVIVCTAAHHHFLRCS